MPLFNSAAYLSESLASVQAQTFTDWELILIDDASTDASAALAQAWAAQDARLRFISLEHHQGPAVARNRGLAAARGRYLAFLDSDDRWLPEKLARQLHWMQAEERVFTFTAYEKINAKGQRLDTLGVPEKVGYHDLLKCCVIGCLTAIYDRRYFGAMQMPLLSKRQDFAFWLQLLKKTDYAYGLNQPLAQYRVHSDSISANKRQAAYFTWRVYRDLEQLGWIKSSHAFAHYAVRGLLRSKTPALARRLGILHGV